MVQTVGRKDLAFHQTEVRGDVGAFGFVDGDGMPDRVGTVFVGPRVEGGEIVVIDLFTVDDHVIQLDGVGATPEERVSGLEPGHEFEGVDELTHGLVLLFESRPFTFPHDYHAVTLGEQSILFETSGFVDVTHGLVAHLVTRLVAVRETLGAPVPEASVEFVHGARPFVVPVHVIGFGSVKDHVFPSVTCVTDVHVGFPVEISQPFQGGEGMGFGLSVPSADGFGSQDAFGHVFGAVEEIAGRGDGDASFEGVETADRFEFLAEHFAGSFEQQHVGLAVGHEFLLKLEDVLGIVRVVPLMEFSGSVGGHALRVVMFLVRQGSDIVLIGWGVEEMGKEAFLLFREPESFGEGGQRHLKEAERVFEHNVSTIDGQRQDFGTVDDLFREDTLFVEFVQNQVRVKPLRVMSQHGEFVIQSQFSQPIEEVSNARGPFETKEIVAVGGGGAHQVGHVNPRVLHGFTVPVHEEFLFLC